MNEILLDRLTELITAKLDLFMDGMVLINKNIEKLSQNINILKDIILKDIEERKK